MGCTCIGMCNDNKNESEASLFDALYVGRIGIELLTILLKNGIMYI